MASPTRPPRAVPLGPLIALAAMAELTAAAGCARVTGATGRDASTSVDGPGTTSHPDAGGGGGSETHCQQVTCTPSGGRYCGVIGNGVGCDGTQDCGNCPGDGVCTNGICIGGPSCVALACSAAGGVATYCGSIGDGCGRPLDCGMCGPNQACSGGICVPASGCIPLACDIKGGGRYCGNIGDGCGGTLPCGDCTAPSTCGGGGVMNVCGAPASLCTPISCMPMGGGQYCGDIGNGCGGTQHCPDACPMGSCSAEHVCPSTTSTCSNLQCQIDKCDAGSTTISGTVYDPAGRNPLYNVILYVPNTALDPIRTGESCDRCDSPTSGHPVAAALSDATGHFHIENAPSGTNIPLVIQIGKWRRQITLPQVKACQDNAFADPTLVRLPRTQAEGNIPHIALATGRADSVDCLLRKIGIADSEFTNDTGTGRVHLYKGGGSSSGDAGATTLATGAALSDAYKVLYANATKLAGYDILMLSCEGDQLINDKTPYEANIRQYADNGGRIFMQHLHATWIHRGLPPWPATAVWAQSILPDLAPAGVSIPGFVDTGFPKGAALADWLVAVGASTTRGQLPMVAPQNSVDAVIAPTQRWIHTEAPVKVTSQYVTFNTPVEAAASNQCGRLTFTDVHVIPGEPAGSAFPSACPATMDMAPTEKALEFMLFDLSSCVQVDTTTPTTPPLPPPGATPPPTAVPTPPPAPPPPPPPPPPIIP